MAMNGNINIEEILQQHTVHELRALIAQLEQEGSGKQTELQLMVGSTYHDFIQSADTIAAMQDKSKQMNDQLDTFGQQAESIAKQTQSMLAHASQAASSSSSSSSLSLQQGGAAISGGSSSGGSSGSSSRARANSVTSISTSTHLSKSPSQVQSQTPQSVSPSVLWSWRDITSCRVWGFLDQCDVYSACQLIVAAEAVLALSPAPPATATDDVAAAAGRGSIGLGLHQYLASRASRLLAMSAASCAPGETEAPPSSSSSSSPPLSSSPQSLSLSQSPLLLQRCGGVQYLHQTVVDDCALLFLYGQCDPAESARSMAGLAGLSLCSSSSPSSPSSSSQPPVVGGGELLRMYLEGTDLRLQELCQLLRSGGREEGASDRDRSRSRSRGGGDEEGGGGEGGGDEGMDLERLTGVLVSAVQLLQQTIFNVYLIFFQKTRHSGHSGAGVGAGGSGEDGLFCRYLVEFLMQCVGSEDPDETPPDADRRKQQQQEQLAVVQTHVTQQFPQAAVLTAWRTWILTHTSALQLACVAALEHLTSAPDVAKAQSLTLHQCLHFIPAASASTSSPALGHSADSEAPLPHTLPLSIRIPGQHQSQMQGTEATTSSGASGGANVSAGAGAGVADPAEVWSAACGLLLLPFTLTSTSTSGSGSGSGSAGTHKRGGGGSGNDALLGGVTLWSHVFRKPFITQVEKMLKVSCRDIFHRTKTRLMRTLLALGGAGAVLQPDLLRAEKEQAHAWHTHGAASTRSSSSSNRSGAGGGGRGKRSQASRFASWLVVNPLSLEVSVRESLLPASNSSHSSSSSTRAHQNLQTTESSFSSSSSSSDEWGWVDSYTGHQSRGRGGGGGRSMTGAAPAAASAQRVASSAEVFQAAESLRSQLEADLSEHLLTDIFDQSSSGSGAATEGGQGQGQDVESSATLARSLQVQCCELVGQVLVLLRVMSTNLAAAITHHRGAGGAGERGGGGSKGRRLKAKHGGRGAGSGSDSDSCSGAGVHGVWDGEAALQSGLLLLSRLAWLLHTPQGAFLQDSLSLQAQQQQAQPLSPSGSGSPRGTPHLHHHHHHQQYMTSLEQLQSAFDIADTDGDGVISFAEAMEAVNALWITDDSLTAPSTAVVTASSSSSQGEGEGEGNSSSGPSSLEFLWFDTAPAAVSSSSSSSFQQQQEQYALQLHHPLLTYTMAEFRLVCAQMIPPPAPPPASGTESGGLELNLDSPAACLHSSLSALVTSSLHTFTTSLLQTHLAPSLQAALRRDFPFSASASAAGGNGSASGGGGGGKPSLLGSFRCSWQSLSLSLSSEEGAGGGAGELDQEEGGGGEVLDTPVQPSSAAFRLLTGLSQVSHAAFLSMDTTQSLSLLAEDNSESNSNSNCCLAATSQDALFAQGLEEYLRQLTSVHDQLARSVQGEGGQQLFEDYCVQVVFDLTLCESTLLAALSLSSLSSTQGQTQGQTQREVLRASVQQTRDLWEQHIDPINWSLLSPAVKTQVQRYQQRNQMFIPMGAQAEAEAGTGAEGQDRDRESDPADSSGTGNTSSTGGSAEGSPTKQKQKADTSRFLQLFPASASSSLLPGGTKKGGAAKGGSSSSGSSSHEASSSATVTSKFSLLPLPLTSTLAPFRDSPASGRSGGGAAGAGGGGLTATGLAVLALRGGKVGMGMSEFGKKGHGGVGSSSQSLYSKHSNSGSSSNGEGRHHVPGGSGSDSSAAGDGSGSSKKGKGWFF